MCKNNATLAVIATLEGPAKSRSGAAVLFFRPFFCLDAKETKSQDCPSQSDIEVLLFYPSSNFFSS